MKDCIIVGAGLAGVVLAHRLAARQKTFVIISDHSQRSSEVAGGVYNPAVLKRFTAGWKAKEQMAASTVFYKNVEDLLVQNLFLPIPLYRKFVSVQEQNDWFTASDKPELDDLLEPQVFHSQWQHIEAPHGLGRVNHTGRLLVKDFLDSSLAYFSSIGIGEYREESFEYESLIHADDWVEYKGIRAKRIVFCEGYGVIHNPFFGYLPLRPCKGELLTFRASDLDCDAIVKADGFIFRIKDSLYKIGATYGWDDLTNEPSETAREELIAKLDKIIGCKYEIVGQEAAVRPTVGDRRPLLGRHPEKQNYWVFNGLGTRGVMIAPYVSEMLIGAMFDQKSIPDEVNIERFVRRHKKWIRS